MAVSWLTNRIRWMRPSPRTGRMAALRKRVYPRLEVLEDRWVPSSPRGSITDARNQAPEAASATGASASDAPAGWITYGEGSVSGNTVTVGVAGRPELGTQPIAFHGASAELCAAREYLVTFDYDLFTWDSYNADTGPGTGYWD